MELAEGIVNHFVLTRAHLDRARMLCHVIVLVFIPVSLWTICLLHCFQWVFFVA